MSLTSAKRKFLVGYICFLTLLMILLLACCTLPNWWLFEYKDGSNIINVKIGLWKACYKTNCNETCRDYADVDTRKENITGLNAIRALLLTAIILSFISIILGIVLLFSHTIDTLLSMITSLKMFSWLICGLLAICVAFLVIDNKDASPPLWATPSKTHQVSRDYGWAYIVTCVAFAMSFFLIILISCLLGVVLVYRKKYKHIATSGNSRMSSSKPVDVLKDYDLNGNCMSGKGVRHTRVTEKKDKKEREQTERKSQTHKFSQYSNNGFLPEKRIAPIVYKQSRSAHEFQKGHINPSQEKQYYSSSHPSDYDSTTQYYPKVITSQPMPNQNIMIGLIDKVGGSHANQQSVYYGDYDEDYTQPTFIPAVREVSKIDTAQQTSPDATDRTFKKVLPAHTNQQPVNYPRHVVIPRQTVQAENRTSCTVYTAGERRPSTTLSETTLVFDLAGRNHGHPNPDFDLAGRNHRHPNPDYLY